MHDLHILGLDPLAESFLQALVNLQDLYDPYTLGHERRVANFAAAIGARLGLDANAIAGMKVAALLHDVGKLMLPAEILARPRKLSPGEFALVREHPQWGTKVIAPLSLPWPVAQIIFQHHERMDGSGYPEGLLGDAILLEARIIAVADVIEAMCSHRPYRAALGLDAARVEIWENAGILYDGETAEAALAELDDGFVLSP